MAKGKKKKILLVEDDMLTIDVYKTGLELAGFDVDPIITGEEAINKMEEINENPEIKPDLILLDLVLPDINGIEVLEKIRSFENTKDIKVLILSNYSSKELERKGLLLKSEEYLMKTEHPPSDLAKILKEKLGS